MTVQAQTPVFGKQERSTVRGFKAWIVGLVALAAAGTGIGIGVTAGSSTTEAPATVIAPVTESNAEQRNAYNRLQGKSGAAEQPEVVWYLPGKPGIK